MKTKEIADLLSAQLMGDGNVEITSVAGLDSAINGQLSFASSSDKHVETNASCLLVSRISDVGDDVVQVITPDPKFAFAVIARLLHPPKAYEPSIDPSAQIAPSAVIGAEASVGAFSCIGKNAVIGSGTVVRSGTVVGDDVSIGENCVVHPNVYIENGSCIGNNVILHPGVVIGADGFGYVRNIAVLSAGESEYIKFPQIGTVVIEDDVEIGPNSCIDRGSLGETRIGAGTKLDGLVQVAHNVQIGKRVVIAAQSGIAGSSVIGDDVVIAGQVGIADHVNIAAGTVIGAKSAIFPNKILKQGVYAGIPARPIGTYKRTNALISSLDRMHDQIKTLKRQIGLRDQND